MTKYRVVVNAGQTWKSSFGDECRGVAERCVHLEALNTADAVRKAEGVISAVYPEANTFHSYNAVSELDDPDEVLRSVIGCAKGRELIDKSPVVMWRLREESPAEWLSTPIST